MPDFCRSSGFKRCTHEAWENVELSLAQPPPFVVLLAAARCRKTKSGNKEGQNSRPEKMFAIREFLQFDVVCGTLGMDCLV